uniref:B30.2/SPRY domain-containing protein n=1 Tax=Astyanax mexicanus TaxID=7994 RepID=A0A8B9JU35_ASTMX
MICFFQFNFSGRKLRSSTAMSVPSLQIYESPVQQQIDEGSRSQGVWCSLHSENFNLFCVDDEKLVCAQCVAQDHENHSLCSIRKAAGSRRGTLQTHLQTLRRKLQIFENVKDISNRLAAHITSPFLQTEERIKQEFEKLHQFLRTEKQNRISALRNEEAERSQRIRSKILELDIHITEISTRIAETEDKLRNEVLLLQDFQRSIQRAQYTVPDPTPDSVPLADVAKHLGNLSFNVWRKMKQIFLYYPVVLDPNTANSSLSISPDLSSVSISTENLQIPDNPGRFSAYKGVLGSEGFSSGTHSWVVEVGDSENWVVGVAEESVIRKKTIGAIPENGFYCIWRKDNIIVAGLNYEQKFISPSTVRIILVKISKKKGKVKFTDFDSNKILYTFTNAFRNTLYPYFYNNSRNPLKILPYTISVTATTK